MNHKTKGAFIMAHPSEAPALEFKKGDLVRILDRDRILYGNEYLVNKRAYEVDAYNPKQKTLTVIDDSNERFAITEAELPYIEKVAPAIEPVMPVVIMPKRGDQVEILEDAKDCGYYHVFKKGDIGEVLSRNSSEGLVVVMVENKRQTVKVEHVRVIEKPKPKEPTAEEVFEYVRKLSKDDFLEFLEAIVSDRIDAEESGDAEDFPPKFPGKIERRPKVGDLVRVTIEGDESDELYDHGYKQGDVRKIVHDDGGDYKAFRLDGESNRRPWIDRSAFEVVKYDESPKVILDAGHRMLRRRPTVGDKVRVKKTGKDPFVDSSYVPDVDPTHSYEGGHVYTIVHDAGNDGIAQPYKLDNDAARPWIFPHEFEVVRYV
jgi:ribosomal protein L21E